jgi:large subunit ribosomal protein L19
MNEKIVKFNLSQRDNKDIPKIKTGDIVKVHRKITEGEKERIQIFEGIVIAINGKQSSSPTLTVRKVSSGVGAELVLPIYSPSVEKIEIVKRAKVRRAKLYYIREKSAKSMRLKYKDMADFASTEDEDKAEVSEDIQDKNDEGDSKKEGDKKDPDSKKESKSDDAPVEKKENKEGSSKTEENKEVPASDSAKDKKTE